MQFNAEVILMDNIRIKTKKFHFQVKVNLKKKNNKMMKMKKKCGEKKIVTNHFTWGNHVGEWILFLSFNISEFSNNFQPVFFSLYSISYKTRAIGLFLHSVFFGCTSHLLYAHACKWNPKLQQQFQENTFPIDFKFMEQFTNESCAISFLVSFFSIFFFFCECLWRLNYLCWIIIRKWSFLHKNIGNKIM